MKVRWLFVSLLALLLAARFAPAFAEQILVGDLEEKVLSLHGRPSREISTGRGSILFFGPLLVNIEAGAVCFISRSSSGHTADDREGPAAVASPPAASPSARVRAAPRRRAPADEAVVRVEQKLLDKMRRMLVLEVYRAMVASMSISMRPSAGWGSVPGGSCAALYGEIPRYGEHVSFVDVKDAQSCRISGYGEESETRDNWVTVGEQLGGVWNGGMQ